MTFQTLYRKHRPQRFAEVVGQDHVTGALLNAVREERVGHAYLFSGPRGTGKTTTARILAKALNCTNPAADGEPCSECDSCVEIARARESATVIERDAASARGVEDMRELLRGVDLSVPGKRKVYILDEVHMLTPAASNTLLKTLEEPLPHVIFVLATTEPEAVLPTIRSRTQHFPFHLLPADVLTDHLADIADREGVAADEDTLRLIARRAAGSARDALSLLDQALALGQGKVDPDTVRQLFEATAFERRAEIVAAIDAEDPAAALAALAVVVESGTDPRQVADDLLRHLRDVFLVAASQGKARLDHVPDEERRALEDQGKALGYQRVVRAIETLGEAAIDMRRASDPRLILEVALVRVARREAGSRVDVLHDRVERLERAIEELREGAGGATAASEPSPPSPAAAKDATRPRAALGAVRKRETPAPEASPLTAAEPAAPSLAEAVGGAAPSADAVSDTAIEFDDVKVAWPKALGGMKALVKAVATEAQPVAVDGGTVVLGLPHRLEGQRKRLEDALGQVGELLGRALGRDPVRVRVEMHEGFLDDRPPQPPSEATADDPALDQPALDQPALDEPLPDDAASAPPMGSVERLASAFDATVESSTEGNEA